jgi:undecaprenyl-diphosphatase
MEEANEKKQVAIAILTFCLISFLLITVLRGAFSGINNEVNLWIVTIHNNIFTAVANLVADGFDTTVLLPLSLVIGATLFVVKKRKYALLLVGGMGGNTVILLVLKTFIYSPRPLNGLIIETSNSFPSGHTTSTVVLFGLLTFFAWQTWKSTAIKITSSAIYLTFISLVGFTRLYLNVHWLTDVIGGYFLGAFWVTFCIILSPYIIQLYKQNIQRRYPSKNRNNTHKEQDLLR